MNQKAGIAATTAILAAGGSYVLTFTGNPVWGMVAAILAILAGVIGVIAAASPRVGGGLMSVVSVGLGAVAAVLALLGVVGEILF